MLLGAPVQVPDSAVVVSANPVRTVMMKAVPRVVLYSIGRLEKFFTEFIRLRHLRYAKSGLFQEPNKRQVSRL